VVEQNEWGFALSGCWVPVRPSMKGGETWDKLGPAPLKGVLREKSGLGGGPPLVFSAKPLTVDENQNNWIPAKVKGSERKKSREGREKRKTPEESTKRGSP